MRIAVIGSANVDSTMIVERFPKPGETILAFSSGSSLGGKGANQAAALAKVGADVYMIGQVGNDAEGTYVKQSLSDFGVDNTYLIQDENNPTGRANITVDINGRNHIIVALGSNSSFDRKHVDNSINGIKESDALLFQLEIPIDTVYYALDLGKKMGKLTVLNPAPYQNLSKDILTKVDILIPNEIELFQLTGIEPNSEDALLSACRSIAISDEQMIIVTLGERGCYYYQNGKGKIMGSYKVDAVDTTAAGDSFIGGFMFKYLQTKQLESSIDFGQRVAAIAVSRKGAADSMPYYEEVVKANLIKE